MKKWKGQSMKMYFVSLLLVLGIPVAILLTSRHAKDISKKLHYTNTYAIQNVGTGKDIRVYNAGINDGTKIIIYSHKNWECMTWRFIRLDDTTYLLQNLYTQKTLQPSSSPEAGVDLRQQPLGGSPLQYWEFIKQPDDTYLIRLKGPEFYLTSSSRENNSSIILMRKQDSANQLWRLIKQTPWV